ncbi:Rv0361 family membrane protein [Streptomyces halobius]|uniref:DUF4878 domain-containing protein n=1 Tax=Streptomyces halobius TaxID=2879846 RepID=A0ABY4MHR2_9ACTN|nr:hypothetical protein [Streptomyces halobius]UQA96892.1 hypothetical protein K9S39_37970 [Streptomyces halobius]
MWWYLGAAAVLLAVAGGVTAYLLPGEEESEESRIKKVVADFALAVDRGNTHKMIGLLCLEEARGIADEDDGSGDDERDTHSKPIPIETSDVRIKGDVARVVVTRPAQKPTPVYLRKQKGTWKLCAPAGGSR